jgi:myo-inositol 2-dehydrogenase / D-chiro-inositol 1-dehydrogenase
MARIRLATLIVDDAIDRCVVATRDVHRAAALEQLGAEVVDVESAGELRPDVVFVTSSTASHAEDLQRALRYQRPILCEKPLTSESASAARLVERAATAGTPLHVAFQRHFDPAARALRDRFASGSLGTVYHLRFTHFDQTVGTPEFIAASGGMFRDMLVHDIECALWLTQRSVQSVLATGSVRRWTDYADCDDCDTATVLLTMDDGLTVTIHGTRHHPLGQDVRIEALGSEDAVSIGLTAATPINALDDPKRFNEQAPQGFEEASAPALEAETRAFTDFALGRTDTFDGASARIALEAQRVADACELSRARGAAVELAAALSRAAERTVD